MSDASLNASFWVMILLRTMGSFDLPGKGPRKMPAPAAFVPTIIAWLVLQVAADAGARRQATKLGWLIVLVALVLGPFGKLVIKVANWVSQEYGVPVSSQQQAAGGTTQNQVQNQSPSAGTW